MLYNKPEHAYHKLAARMKVSSAPILAKLDSISRARMPSAHRTLPFGDLEQSLEILRLLCDPNTVQSSTDLIIEPDPLASLFVQEFERRKESPPVPPKAPKPTSSGIPKIRIRDRRLRKGDASHSSQALLDMAPGFRGSRTMRSSMVIPPTAGDAEGQDRIDPSSSGQVNDSPTPVFLPSMLPKTFRAAPARTRSARALAAAFEAEANALPPEVKAAAEKEAADEAAALERAATMQKSEKRRVTREKKRSRDAEGEEHEAKYSPSAASGMPQFVDEVDDMQSFKMFNEGWVLPAGSRRGNRAPATERVFAPLPRRGASSVLLLQRPYSQTRLRHRT